MNQSQIKYAINRVDVILKMKIDKIREVKPKKETKLNIIDSVCVLVDGKSYQEKQEIDKLYGKASNESAGYVHIRGLQYYVYMSKKDTNRIEKERLEHKSKEEKLYMQNEEKVSEIIQKAKTIKDQLMLGDCDEALKMLAEFEKF